MAPIDPKHVGVDNVDLAPVLKDFQVVYLPKQMSPADERRVDELKRRLLEIRKEYEAAVQPVIDQITDIEALYPPRVILVPEGKA